MSVTHLGQSRIGFTYKLRGRMFESCRAHQDWQGR